MLIAALLVNADNISFHDEATSKKEGIENLSRMLAANTSAATAEKIFSRVLLNGRLWQYGLGKGRGYFPRSCPGKLTSYRGPLNADTGKRWFEGLKRLDGKPIDIAFGFIGTWGLIQHSFYNTCSVWVTLFRDEENL